MTTNDQLSAFPMTKVETAELFLVHFQAGVDKAEKSLDTARANLMHACQLRDIAEGNLRRMQDDGVRSVAEVAAEIVNSGALDTDSMTVTATVNAAGVDPVTGEVAQLIACPTCSGDGRLPDKTGGGHHRCKACDGSGKVPYMPAASPFVFAVYPGSANAHKTEVGERTRYAELVSDYFSAAGIEGDVADWQVLAEDELTHNGGGGRNLTAPIQPRDYGRCLIVAAADQGSAAE